MPLQRRNKERAASGVAVLASGLLALIPQSAQARVNTPVVSQTPGPTPFIENVTVDVSAGGTLNTVYYVIYPQAGAKTRPFGGSYTGSYLAAQGFQTGGTVNIPVPFLYAGSTNKVDFLFYFSTSKGPDYGYTRDTITTSAYADPCNRLNTPVLQQNRVHYSDLNYDFFLLKNTCSSDFPAILDTDANVRWVGPRRSARNRRSYSTMVFIQAMVEAE